MNTSFDEKVKNSLSPDATRRRAVAGRIVAVASSTMSKHAGTFGDWMLGGTVGTLTLAFPYAGALSSVVSAPTLLIALQLLVIAALLGSWQRLVASEVAQIAGMLSPIEEIADKAEDDDVKEQLLEISSVFVEATPRLFRAKVLAAMERAGQDPAAYAIRMARRAHHVYWVVSAQAASVLIAAWVMISGLRP